MAFSVKGDILWNDICPGVQNLSYYPSCELTGVLGPEKLGRSKVVLDEGQYYGGIQQDGKFTM